MCLLCACGLPTYYLDLSGTLERSHIRGRTLGTVVPSLVHALGFYHALGSAITFLIDVHQTF